MAGLIDAAAAIMGAAARRLDVAAGNVSNATTAGFKALRLSGGAGGDFEVARARSAARMAQGNLQVTGRALDLAIEGSGFFAVRDGDMMLYTRAGEFQLGADGTLQTSQGFVVQQAGGGDVVIGPGAAPTVGADGAVMQAGRPVARLAIAGTPQGVQPEPLGGALFALPGEPVELKDPVVRQGVIERSNVSVGDEMVSIMAALRSAESGAKIVQLYDDLLGKAATAFGEGGR